MRFADFSPNTDSAPATLDVLKTWQRITTRSIKELPVDLSSRQMGLLLTVYLAPPPHTIRSLSQRLGISKPAVCRAVDMLSGLDLLKRKRDEEDRRNVFIQRTISGSVFLSDFADIIMQETNIAPAEETAARPREVA